MSTNTKTQSEKAVSLRDLHNARSGFVVPNPWDVGSAKILASLGFKALASTSSGFAYSKGLSDHAISRELILAHLTELAQATDLPLTADFEDGFGSTPEYVFDSIRMVAETGVVGASIEDSSKNPEKPLLDLAVGVERMKAASAAAKSLPFPFILIGRAENYFVGNSDLSDTIKRLQAYEDAGANMLFAPGIKERLDIQTLLKEVSCPVNVLIGVAGMSVTIPELRDLGVSRLSVGGSLARSAIASLYRDARELIHTESSTYVSTATSGKFLNDLFDSSVVWRRNTDS